VNPDPSPSARSHENAAFVRTAVEQYQAPLLRYATRLVNDPDRARDVVQDTIDRLTPHQQEVIRLKFQNGFSYREISRITSLSSGNVGFLIHTAITTLRREWAAEAK